MIFVKPRKKHIRAFFATDIHGSDVCWRKFLNAWRHYQADVLILGGDMTGKAIVPIVEKNTSWYTRFLDVEYTLRDSAEIIEFEQVVASRGIILTEVEFHDFETNQSKREALFFALMLRRVEQWMQLADERLPGTGIRCYVCPGNDDPFEIDEVIRRSKGVELAEGQVVEFSGYQMISSGWTNWIPWKTFREKDEDALFCRIRQMARQLTAPPGRVLFNLHSPPYTSGLDEAPEVTEDLRPRYAGRVTRAVGSRAVRWVIEEFQPRASLHGHIHEGRGATRIGRTLCVNPGSAYEQGQLLGAVLDLDGSDTLSCYVLTIWVGPKGEGGFR